MKGERKLKLERDSRKTGPVYFPIGARTLLFASVAELEAALTKPGPMRTAWEAAIRASMEPLLRRRQRPRRLPRIAPKGRK